MVADLIQRIVQNLCKKNAWEQSIAVLPLYMEKAAELLRSTALLYSKFIIRYLRIIPYSFLFSAALSHNR